MKYLIALILLLAPFGAYAGGSVHHNDNDDVSITNSPSSSSEATAGSEATGGNASARVERGMPMGQPGGISPAWTCSQAYSISSLFLGFSYTTDNEFCMLREQKREVCWDSPESQRCTDLKKAVADWEPAKSQEVSTAAE